MRAVVALAATQLPSAPTQRQADAVADCLASFPQEARNRFAKRAGCLKPGPITWKLVCEEIRARGAERRAS